MSRTKRIAPLLRRHALLIRDRIEGNRRNGPGSAGHRDLTITLPRARDTKLYVSTRPVLDPLAVESLRP